MNAEVNFRTRLNDNVDKAQKRLNEFSTRANAILETSNERRKELAQQLSIAAIFERLSINQDGLAALIERVEALETQVAALAKKEAARAKRKPRAKKTAAK